MTNNKIKHTPCVGIDVAFFEKHRTEGVVSEKWHIVQKNKEKLLLIRRQ